MTTDRGSAGASAQRRFDRLEAERRSRLRRRWPSVFVIGAIGAVGGGVFAHVASLSVWPFALLGLALALMSALARPQTTDAWRVGAAGERATGAMLDSIGGVIALHDRRMPGSRANIDHVVVASSGVWVVDTKNVAGRVQSSRSTLRVAGRRRDDWLTGMHRQIAAVERVLADQNVGPVKVKGVLCFRRADLEWSLLRSAPQGIRLEYPRGVRKLLRQPGPLTGEVAERVAAVIGQRLPPA